MFKTIKNPCGEIFDRYIKEAICRHESSQHKAHRILREELQVVLSDTDFRELVIEADHFNMGEFEAGKYCEFLKQIKLKYFKD